MNVYKVSNVKTNPLHVLIGTIDGVVADENIFDIESKLYKLGIDVRDSIDDLGFLSYDSFFWFTSDTEGIEVS